MPSSAKAQTTLASWTFDTGYDVSENVYTPNANEWAAVGWNGFSTLPQIRPNTYVGTITDYYASAKGARYWGIQDNKQDDTTYGKYFGLYQDQDPNSISDYTDATQHNQYFEFSFPTTGYSNITFTFAFTDGSNGAYKLELVYSIDGGTTWIDLGAYSGAAGWWYYNTNNAGLSVSNKSNVIVRLIAENGITAQWRMNAVSITGEAIDVSKSSISFSKPVSVEGVVPASQTIDINSSFTIPQNYTLYKEGYTLTGWTDGESTFNIGTAYTMTKTVYELSPVFTANTVSLNDRTSAVTVNWDLRHNNGAPIKSWEKNTGILVAQATVNGATIDVKMDIDATSGKFDIVERGDYCQINPNTIVSIPSNPNTEITIDAWYDTYDYQIGGIAVDQDVARTVYVYTGTDNPVAIKFVNSAYFNYIKAVYPAPQTVDVTITSALYATYYNSALALTVPANLQAATVDGESGGALTLNWRYNEGDVIPAGTPVLLKATTANTYTLTEKIGDATAAPTGNLLYGSDTETTTTGGGTGAKYYALQYGTGANASVLGFYWMAADGAAFTSGAHKAWLALPAAVDAPFFTLEGGTTGINQVNGEGLKVQGEYYNLAGQRVAQPTKGLYIVGGKKVIVK